MAVLLEERDEVLAVALSGKGDQLRVRGKDVEQLFLNPVLPAVPFRAAHGVQRALEGGDVLVRAQQSVLGRADVPAVGVGLRVPAQGMNRGRGVRIAGRGALLPFRPTALPGVDGTKGSFLRRTRAESSHNAVRPNRRPPRR
jgi:hypothetical protein